MKNREDIIKNNLDYTLFSWSKQTGLNPLCIEKAEGVYIYDYNGKRYLDFSSQLMNVNIGHGHPKVLDAVTEQMKKVSYVTPSSCTDVRGELGKKLAEISPGNLTKTFFTLSGADSIDHAIKMARLYTGKHKIICRYRSFHGASYGAMSAGGDPRKLAVDSQQAPGFVHVEDPYCYRCPWSQKIESCKRECVDHVERVIEFEGAENIAAILMEGESGSSGCMKYPPDYWHKLRLLADKYNILLISDEVMSGFGRTGKWFGVDHSGVVPDMIVMAKGITSGYLPLGGIIVTDKIAKHFDENILWLGLTYSAHPVSCAAALAVIDVYEKENLIENASKMGKLLEVKMEVLKRIHPSIGEFRNTGLLGCLELVKNRQSREPMAPFNGKGKEMEVMNKVAAKIRELGMYTFVRWNYIFTAPPLTINEEQIEEGVKIISEALLISDKECR